MLAYSSIENMGILAIGTALGGVGVLAAIIHLIGHSLFKASFFMTAGNIFKIYKTKKIKSVTALFATDKKTALLWIASFLGITAFPPSVLFISEFLIVKTMLQNGYYILTAVFLLLLTIVLYGLAKAIFSMSANINKTVTAQKLSIFMYLPQAILLIIAFVMGIYLPFIDVIKQSVIGF
jgi:hydrogenase-4 component F